MTNFLRVVSGIVVVCALLVTVTIAQKAPGPVTLTESSVTWQTVDYTLDETGAVAADSVDSNRIEEHTFITYILENDFLRVTLLPEYGGRILSMIYKPTGHEQLYQNPLGLPYGIGDGNFYYDWLMVYGGIFPTFPEPEHGKTWFLPWSFEIITESPETVTVRMSFVDNITFTGTPGKFNPNPTDLEVDFDVTLTAGRSALETQVTLRNPTDKAVNYEYWTCVTLAPGSESGQTRATADTEIIAPIEKIKMPPWWPATIDQEKPAGMRDVYIFDNLRLFENWADMGIAYTYPDMSSANFWGAINHSNEEGLIRVGDNTVTSGLKIWTWGSDSMQISADDYAVNESRPYIELWAGVTPEFFSRTMLDANTEIIIPASYIPTVGLTQVTHANNDVLVNFFRNDSGDVQLQVFSARPARPVHAIITTESSVVVDVPLDPDPMTAAVLSVEVPDGAQHIAFELLTDDGTQLLTGTLSP